VETEVKRETPLQYYFIHNKSHTDWPRIEPEPLKKEPDD
jgi:hypothetical protein